MSTDDEYDLESLRLSQDFPKLVDDHVRNSLWEMVEAWAGSMELEPGSVTVQSVEGKLDIRFRVRPKPGAISHDTSPDVEVSGDDPEDML